METGARLVPRSTCTPAGAAAAAAAAMRARRQQQQRRRRGMRWRRCVDADVHCLSSHSWTGLTVAGVLASLFFANSFHSCSHVLPRKMQQHTRRRLAPAACSARRRALVSRPASSSRPLLSCSCSSSASPALSRLLLLSPSPSLSRLTTVLAKCATLAFKPIQCRRGITGSEDRL